MEKYDLTNPKTLLQLSSLMGGPIIPLAFKLLDKIFGSEATKEQGRVAAELIRHGKENGVDEMEITVNNTKGFKLNVPLDDGIKVDTVIGSDEKMTIKVKYK